MNNKLNILHLYYDLMNLYGESGNIKAIEYYLTQQNIKTNIIQKSINDDIDLSHIDLIYIGCSTETNQLIGLNHLKQYKEELKDYIENNKFIIATGNSFELFGKIIHNNNKEVKGLNIFDYQTIKTEKRIVNEGIFKTNLIKENIIGFQNHNNKIETNNPILLPLKTKGTPIKCDGYNYKNFYGTYTIGPLLVRNPKLLTYLLNKLIKEKYKDKKLKKVDLKLDELAYQEFINNYYK